jgi:hypothetical protein
MSRNIGNITTAQTFQNWLEKTNALVDVLAVNVMTASTSSPETTNGDAILAGSFTATNLVASALLSSDTISAASGGGTIDFNSPILITGASATTATFKYAGTGGQVRFTDGSLSWDVGLESSNPGNFIIDTGTGANKFQLSPAGTLTVPNAVVTENLTVGSLTIGPGGAGLSTDDVSEGSTNLYHTTARARAAFSGGDGINLSATGVISFDGQGELDTYKGNKFFPTGSYQAADSNAYMGGTILAGLPAGTFNVLSGSVVSTPLYWFGAGIQVDGYMKVTGSIESDDNITSDGGIIYVKTGSTIKASIDQSGNGFFTGDVTTNGSASDERLKENIIPLEYGLEQVKKIKTYKFNYKDRPQDIHPGVIAQEIEEIIPEVVYNIEMDGDTYKAVRYQQLVPVLIEAIKELSEKVIVLEKKLENKV